MFGTPREAGSLLRRIRAEAGLSRAELAGRAGVSTRWLVSFEKGKPSVDMSLVMDCFQVLGFGFDLVPMPREAVAESFGEPSGSEQRA